MHALTICTSTFQIVDIRSSPTTPTPFLLLCKCKPLFSQTIFQSPNLPITTTQASQTPDMAKSFSLLSILLPLLFISFTSTHALHIPGHCGRPGALLPLPITSPPLLPLPILSSCAAPVNLLPQVPLPPYQAINPLYPYPNLASPYTSYNQLVGDVSPYSYASQFLGAASLFNQLHANQVFNQLQSNQLFQQQQANQAFNQLEANQLFSQLQANQVFNQQQANQLFITSQLANYLNIPNAISYPSAYACPSARPVVV